MNKIFTDGQGQGVLYILTLHSLNAGERVARRKMQVDIWLDMMKSRVNRLPKQYLAATKATVTNIAAMGAKRQKALDPTKLWNTLGEIESLKHMRIAGQRHCRGNSGETGKYREIER